MEKENVNNKDFSLYNKILDFDNYTNKYVINNISAVHRDIRIHFLDETFSLSKNMFYATYNKGSIRMKYLTELQVNISLLDMMLFKLRNFSTMKKHHIDVSISELSDIKNIVYGWKFNEEKEKK